MFEKGLTDVINRIGAQRLRKIHAMDLGADVRRNGLDLDRTIVGNRSCALALNGQHGHGALLRM
jgi:hypothetical protein